MTQDSTNSRAVQALHKHALKYPEAQQSTSCNKVAFKARKKNFVFIGTGDTSYNIMLKLGDSISEATLLASKKPNNYRIGSSGWVTAVFNHDQSPPKGLLESWIDESYRLLVHKQLVGMLADSAASPKAAARKPARKK